MRHYEAVSLLRFVLSAVVSGLGGKWGEGDDCGGRLKCEGDDGRCDSRDGSSNLAPFSSESIQREAMALVQVWMPSSGSVGRSLSRSDREESVSRVPLSEKGLKWRVGSPALESSEVLFCRMTRDVGWDDWECCWIRGDEIDTGMECIIWIPPIGIIGKGERTWKRQELVLVQNKARNINCILGGVVVKPPFTKTKARLEYQDQCERSVENPGKTVQV